MTNYISHAEALRVSKDASLPMWDAKIRGYHTRPNHTRVERTPRTVRVHALDAGHARAVAIALTSILDGSVDAWVKPADVR